MAKMTAMDALVRVLESEGVEVCFGVPGAAILPLYDSLRKSKIRHILCRHEEGATHMAEGYTRAKAGKIGVVIGTSGPAGTNMVTGMYSAVADSIPILCLTGQGPRAQLHKEFFQAVDTPATTRPVSKWSETILEAAMVPWAARKAFRLMREGRPGPVHLDFPLDIQGVEIDYDPDLDSPLEVSKPKPNQAAIESALDMLMAAERPIILAGGGVLIAEASKELIEFAELTNTPVMPTLMGWGSIPDDHPLNVGRVGCQTGTRGGNLNFLDSDLVLGVGNRWASRHTGGLDTYRKGRKFIHINIDPTQLGRVFGPDLGIVSDAKEALTALVEAARRRAKEGRLVRRNEWTSRCATRNRTLQRRLDFPNTPIKPQRVFHEVNKLFGPETCFVTCIGLYQIASGQYQKVYKPRNYIVCGQAGPLGWEVPASIGVKLAHPEKEVVAISGDYSIQFLFEELAVAAQAKIPFVVVLLNNAYLGLIRQAEKGFNMDFEVQLSFENINCPENGGYGVDFEKGCKAFGCLAKRVFDPAELAGALEWARKESAAKGVPAIIEVITERKTDMAMGPNIDQIKEFEETVDVA